MIQHTSTVSIVKMAKSKVSSKRQTVHDSLRDEFEETLDARNVTNPEPSDTFPKAVPLPNPSDVQDELIDDLDDDALLNEPMASPDLNMTGLTMFQTFKDDLGFVVNTICDAHFDYVLAGLCLGLHSPMLGWMVLSSVFTAPTVILVQHSDWFNTTDLRSWLYLAGMVSFSLVSDIYVFYYLSRSVN